MMTTIKWIWSDEGFYYGVVNGVHRYGLRADKDFNVYGGDPVSLIIGGTIAAAGAVGAGAIAASGAQKAAETQAEAQQKAIDLQQQELEAKKAAGEKAIALKSQALEEFKLPGILETPEGADLLAKLKQREAGVGVGYSQEVLNKDTAATAAQTRASLKEQTIPAINTAASSRGLGRSTIPVSMTGQATQAAERDIESRIAQLQVASEAQKSVDIQNALTQHTALAESQVKAKQAEAGTRLTGEFNIADTEIGVADSNFKDTAYIGELISQQGATAASYQLQQAALWAGAVQGATSSFSNSMANSELLSAIKDIKSENNARVNIAGQAGSPSGTYRLLPASLSL
jgi:hypothetical protein